MSLWSQFATLNIYEIYFVKGAASRMEDLPYSLFHYRPILTTILLKAKIRIITCLDKRIRPFY